MIIVFQVKKVRDVMNQDVIKIDAAGSISEATKLMAKAGVGSLMVMSNGKVVGIITERDIVTRVLAKSYDPAKVLIGDAMSTPLFTVSSEHTLREAAKVMVKSRVRRLPVVDNGVLVGICTATDLARSLADKLQDEQEMLEAIARHLEPPTHGPYA